MSRLLRRIVGMSETPPPPDEKRCTATNKKRGDRCRNYALKGLKTCRFHGSASKKAREAGRRRHEKEVAKSSAERSLRRLGVPLAPEEIDPIEKLLSLIAQKNAEIGFLDRKIQELGSDDELVWGVTKHVTGVGPEGPVDQETSEARQNIWWIALKEAQDQLARYLTAALRANIEERQTKVAESAGQMVAGLITQLKTRLQLTGEQEDEFDAAVVEIMQAATGAQT
jgi:hypothetical protein